MEKIHQKTALELAALIKHKEVSSQEVTAHFIARIETHNPKINTVIAERFDDALKDAEAFDNNPQTGAFAGVPMTIKDCFEVDGLTCEIGNPAWQGKLSQADSVVAQKLRQQGVIFLGKTNTPLFAGDWQSYNDLHGTTNNPWHLEHTPGGSSGGSGAALAAGMTPLEYGSDIGGSIRVPAHYCGLFGHKPTLNLVSARGHVPPAHGDVAESNLAVVGPLAKSTDDLNAALAATMGLLPPKSAALQLQLPAPRATSAKGLRVGIWADDPYCEVDKEITATIETAGKKLEEAGAQVQIITPDFDFAEQVKIFMMMLNPIIGMGFPPSVKKNLRAYIDAHAGEENLRMWQAQGILLGAAEWNEWNEKRWKLGEIWARLFEQIDVLFCPVTPSPAMPHTQANDVHARTMVVNGKTRPYFENIIWASLPITCGLPATAVPLGTHSSGLPMGMQIIGPYWEDNTPLATAKILEDMGYTAELAPDFRD